MMMFYAGVSCAADVAKEKARRGQKVQRAYDSELSTPKKEAAPMVGNPEAEVKVRPLMFAVGNEEDKLSVAYAMAQGYRIVVGGDGEGEVTNPAGKTYHIRRFECDCPDKAARGGSHQGHCKHEWWLAQMRPCQMCGAIMYFGEFRTAFGETLRRFECPACGNARDQGMVREERRALREGGPQDEDLTPEGRCRHAIAWLQARYHTRYIWYVVEQSPELAPVMVRMLVEAGEQALAEKVAAKYAVEAKVA